jgi:hypothetical protein
VFGEKRSAALNLAKRKSVKPELAKRKSAKRDSAKWAVGETAVCETVWSKRDSA